MGIEIYHSITCDVEGCESKDDRVFRYYRDMTLPVPYLPKGWTEIGGRQICPRHEVTVTIRPEGAEDQSVQFEMTGRRA